MRSHNFIIFLMLLIIWSNKKVKNKKGTKKYEQIKTLVKEREMPLSHDLKNNLKMSEEKQIF